VELLTALALQIVLHATIHASDHQSYRTLGFDVPPGTARITVVYEYTGRDAGTTIDAGLLAPDGFRGWSGGNKKRFTVSATDATPSYLPGPLAAGRWNLLLGVPNIRPGQQSEVTATVELEATAEGERATYDETSAPVDGAGRAVRGEPNAAGGGTESAVHGELAGSELSKAGTAPALLPAVPLRSEAGWYRGDLHMHTGHSDGSCANQSGMRVPCPLFLTVQAAADAGLDFIAITEHNTVSHLNEMRALQPYFDRLLLIAGMEVTTFKGHANAFGVTGPVDFRAGLPVFDELAKQGAVVSINHPNAPSGEICMGCGWTTELPRAAQAIEAVNGADADTPVSGIAFWHQQLDKGLRLTGIGGSDNHDAKLTTASLGRSRIAAPTTVVYARELSLAGIQDGIRAGNVFVDVAGARDRLLEMSATAGSITVPMGGDLKARKGTTVTFKLRLQNAGDATLVEWIRDGKILPNAATRMELMERSDGARHWVRVNVRDVQGHLLLVGNPIYLNRNRMSAETVLSSCAPKVAC
jgi:hypothetical protein